MPKGKVTPFTCPRCGSNVTYFRILTRQRVCRYCGNVWDDVTPVETVPPSLEEGGRVVKPRLR